MRGVPQTSAYCVDAWRVRTRISWPSMLLGYDSPRNGGSSRNGMGTRSLCGCGCAWRTRFTPRGIMLVFAYCPSLGSTMIRMMMKSLPLFLAGEHRRS